MSAPLVETAPTLSAADVLRAQQELKRTNNYELMGRVWAIIFEAAEGAATPAQAVTNSQGVRFDFYGYDVRSGAPLLPRIAQTHDRNSLLLLDPITRADGSVGLPDIPDPAWVPTAPTADQICWDPSDPKNKGKKAPAPWSPQASMIRQEFADRARGQLKGSRYLVFGPVAQILVRPEGLPTGWILECGGDIYAGRMMELLVDQDTGEGFFYGGKFQICRTG